MSKIFPHVTRQNPCPICGKTDWCQFGDRAVKCMRIESAKPCPSGGWWHFYGDKPTIKPVRILPKRESKPIDAAGLMKRLFDDTRFEQYETLAASLCVDPKSLIDLGAGWSPAHGAWAFPMFDGQSRVIGIRLRWMNGEKKAVTGSHQGIFFPTYFDCNSDIAYLPEGPTDTAALLSLGLFAIGRPTCSGGNDYILEVLTRLQIHKAVIVADNDEIKNTGKRPGLEGALKLKEYLKLKSVIWIPPSPMKDVREFLRNGGTARQIESEINQKVWTK